MYSTEDKVTELSRRLARIHQRKLKLKVLLVKMEEEEHNTAVELNGALGVIPLEEAARKTQLLMSKAKVLESKAKSQAMHNAWDRKTPEERVAWKAKLGKRRKII